jgi:hypothetical protein
MLRPLGPGKLVLEGMRFLPPILSPLIDAAKRGEPLEPVVATIVHVRASGCANWGRRPKSVAASCRAPVASEARERRKLDNRRTHATFALRPHEDPRDQDPVAPFKRCMAAYKILRWPAGRAT